jgi:hypothetical protein
MPLQLHRPAAVLPKASQVTKRKQAPDRLRLRALVLARLCFNSFGVPCNSCLYFPTDDHRRATSINDRSMAANQENADGRSAAASEAKAAADALAASLYRASLIGAEDGPAVRVTLSLLRDAVGAKDDDEVDNLELMSQCRDLYLQHNRLTRIAGLETLLRLEFLALGGNRLTRLEGLATLRSLRVLDVSENLIQELPDDELPAGIRIFNGYGNPVANTDPTAYVQRVLALLPACECLDGTDVEREHVPGAGGDDGEDDEEADNSDGEEDEGGGDDDDATGDEAMGEEGKRRDRAERAGSPSASKAEQADVASRGGKAGSATASAAPGRDRGNGVGGGSTTGSLSGDNAGGRQPEPSGAGAAVTNGGGDSEGESVEALMARYHSRRTETQERYRLRLEEEGRRMAEMADTMLSHSAGELAAATARLQAMRIDIVARSRLRLEEAAGEATVSDAQLAAAAAARPPVPAPDNAAATAAAPGPASLDP